MFFEFIYSREIHSLMMFGLRNYDKRKIYSSQPFRGNAFVFLDKKLFSRHRKAYLPNRFHLSSSQKCISVSLPLLYIHKRPESCLRVKFLGLTERAKVSHCLSGKNCFGVLCEPDAALIKWIVLPYLTKLLSRWVDFHSTYRKKRFVKIAWCLCTYFHSLSFIYKF